MLYLHDASICHISKCVKKFSDPTVPFLNKHQSLQCIGALNGILSQYMVILGNGCVHVAFNAQEHWKQSKFYKWAWLLSSVVMH